MPVDCKWGFLGVAAVIGAEMPQRITLKGTESQGALTEAAGLSSCQASDILSGSPAVHGSCLSVLSICFFVSVPFLTLQ